MAVREAFNWTVRATTTRKRISMTVRRPHPHSDVPRRAPPYPRLRTHAPTPQNKYSTVLAPVPHHRHPSPAPSQHHKHVIRNCGDTDPHGHGPPRPRPHNPTRRTLTQSGVVDVDESKSTGQPRQKTGVGGFERWRAVAPGSGLRSLPAGYI